jgi:hypothetical protein
MLTTRCAYCTAPDEPLTWTLVDFVLIVHRKAHDQISTFQARRAASSVQSALYRLLVARAGHVRPLPILSSFVKAASADAALPSANRS